MYLTSTVLQSQRLIPTGSLLGQNEDPLPSGAVGGAVGGADSDPVGPTKTLDDNGKLAPLLASARSYSQSCGLNQFDLMRSLSSL